jgi:hypothetical protein
MVMGVELDGFLLCMHFGYNFSLRLDLVAFLLYYTIDQYLNCINHDSEVSFAMLDCETIKLLFFVCLLARVMVVPSKVNSPLYQKLCTFPGISKQAWLPQVSASSSLLRRSCLPFG